MRAARDGMEVFVTSALHRGRGSKSTMRLTLAEKGMVAVYIDTMIYRSYLEDGFVESKVHFSVFLRGRMIFGSYLMGRQAG
jgi:hypothetical protein